MASGNFIKIIFKNNKIKNVNYLGIKKNGIKTSQSFTLIIVWP